MQWAGAGIQMISGVAWKICLPRNFGGREVFRKTEKKLVTALRGFVAFRFGFFPNLNGRLGLKNIALGISTAYFNFNESICGVPQGLNEVPKAGRSRHG